MSRVRVLTAGGQDVSVAKFKMPKKPAGQSLVKKVAKLEKQIKQQEGEWKYLDTTQSVTASVSAGALTLLNGCQQGDGPSNREGTQIFIKSIQIRIRTEFNALDASAGPMRFVVVQDKQPNGAAPTVSNIYQTSSLLAIDALRNLDGRKRFKILADRSYVMSQNGTPGFVDDIYLKRPITVQYNSGNAGTVADISTNSIYVLIASDQAANGPFTAFYARIRFTE